MLFVTVIRRTSRPIPDGSFPPTTSIDSSFGVNGWLIAAVTLMSALVLYTPCIAQPSQKRDLIEDICTVYLSEEDHYFRANTEYPRDFSGENPEVRAEKRDSERLSTLLDRWERRYPDDSLWRGDHAFMLCSAILGRTPWPPLLPGEGCSKALPEKSACGRLKKRCDAAQMFPTAACIPLNGLFERARCTSSLADVMEDQCRRELADDDARCKSMPQSCAQAKAATPVPSHCEVCPDCASCRATPATAP